MQRCAQLAVTALFVANDAAQSASLEPYPVLWDDNSIETAALLAVGIQPNAHRAMAPNTIQDWPAQDAPASYCVSPFAGYCLRGQWPIADAKGVRNGGVPQNASLSAHLAEIRRTMPFGVAENFTGIVAIDFESWAPIWSEDTSKDGWHSAVYQNLSISLVLQNEPKLPLAEAKAKAQKAFESAALEFFVETIKLCRELRPKARWGYYGFPQAFTFNGYDTANGAALRSLNDRLQPLWDASDVNTEAAVELSVALCHSADSGHSILKGHCVRRCRCCCPLSTSRNGTHPQVKSTHFYCILISIYTWKDDCI